MKDTKSLKWIFEKTKFQTFNFIMLNIINIIYSVLSIYLILISKGLIDAAVAQSVVEIKSMLLKLIIVTTIEIILRAMIASLETVTRAKLEINFRQNVLNTILKRNYEKITTLHSGELMTRINTDTSIIINTLVTLIPNMLSMLVRLICAMLVLFKVSKEFTVIFIIGGIIIFLVTNILKPHLKKIHKKMQEASANVYLFFQEVLENLLVIKIFQSEETVSKKATELQDKMYKIQMKRRNISIVSGLGFSIIFRVSYLYALIWSAYNLYLGKITVGGLTSIVQLISQIQTPIVQLSRTFQNIFAMTASAERIIELEKINEDKITEEIDSNKLYQNLKNIVVEDVNFTYKNNEVFHKASCKVKKGNIVAIYGESGIGKSTLLKLILGIVQNNDGKIYFELENEEQIQIGTNTRNMFAYVPQGNFILSGTIRENITFANSNASAEEIKNALQISDCEKFISKLPEGINTKIGERGKGLSEGQLQRLALARAIISKAPILILDEVTSSLDSNTEMKVLQNIKNMSDRTCIIVTHRTIVSKVCDLEFIVEDKKITEKAIAENRKEIVKSE